MLQTKQLKDSGPKWILVPMKSAGFGGVIFTMVTASLGLGIKRLAHTVTHSFLLTVSIRQL